MTRLCNLEDIQELETQGEREFFSSEIYKDPQLVYIIQENRLELIKLFEKYIACIMNSSEKPYRVVSVCYTLILFHKYHPETTMLGSPNWSYTRLKEASVEEGAASFQTELVKWFNNSQFVWGRNQKLGIKEVEDGVMIGDMIFGRCFTPKDFENWSNRMRKNIRRQLMEKEVECYDREASFQLGL